MKYALSLIGVIATLMLAVVAFQTCGHRDTGPKIPLDVQHKLDSLANTADEFRAHADSVLATMGKDTVTVVKIKHKVDTLMLKAKEAEALADSLARAKQWEGAYRAEKVANDSLHAAVDSLDNALTIERRTSANLLNLHERDTLRLSRTEQANAGLKRAIAVLEKPCRIVGPIPCPSRTVTFVLSAAGGAAAMAIASNASKE